MLEDYWICVANDLAAKDYCDYLFIAFNVIQDIYLILFRFP